MKNDRLSLFKFKPERPRFLVAILLGLITSAVLLVVIFRTSDNPLFCNTPTGSDPLTESTTATTTQLYRNTILHYATTKITPQQSFDEITISLDVLKSLPPCNFLVFGLGYDSLMWASFNSGGTTLFLEEDAKWVQTVLKDAPTLHAHTVNYRTKLSQADELLSSYLNEPDCWAYKSFIRGNNKCRLALDTLPEEVYEKEWDLIMIDAPRGYFDEAPGRMAAIYSAAVMSRNRKRSGVTHVFLHDVNRKVEKVYAETFLCRKNLVKGVGRLWHFEIPSAANVSRGGEERKFC